MKNRISTYNDKKVNYSIGSLVSQCCFMAQDGCISNTAYQLAGEKDKNVLLPFKDTSAVLHVVVPKCSCLGITNAE